MKVFRILIVWCALYGLITAGPAYSFVRDINMDGQRFAVDSKQSVNWIQKTIVPSGRDPSGRLSCPEIKRLAEEFHLFKETKTNPQLGFLDGDISYWCEQPVGEQRIRLEFAARRLVLDSAEQNGVMIRDQGKLSWAAQQIIPDIIQEQKNLSGR